MNVPRLPPIGAPAVALMQRGDLNPAEWMYERLVKQISEFEQGLDSEQEIGMRVAMAGTSEAFHIEDASYWGPDMITLYGKNAKGAPVQLVQHYTQLNILLMAVPKIHDPALRIGFDLQGKQEARKTTEPPEIGRPSEPA